MPSSELASTVAGPASAALYAVVSAAFGPAAAPSVNIEAGAVTSPGGEVRDS